MMNWGLSRFWLVSWRSLDSTQQPVCVCVWRCVSVYYRYRKLSLYHIHWIYIYCIDIYICIFGGSNPINVKTAEPIGSTFLWGLTWIVRIKKIAFKLFFSKSTNTKYRKPTLYIFFFYGNSHDFAKGAYLVKMKKKYLPFFCKFIKREMKIRKNNLV